MSTFNKNAYKNVVGRGDTYNLHANYYIQKPLDLDNFLEIVKK